MQILKGITHFQVRSFTDLRDMLRQSAELFGEQVAFRFKETPKAPVETRTYQQFLSELEALGTAMLAHGLGGKRVAVIGENSYA